MVFQIFGVENDCQSGIAPNSEKNAWVTRKLYLYFLKLGHFQNWTRTCYTVKLNLFEHDGK